MKSNFKRFVASVVSLAMISTMGVSYTFADETTTAQALLNIYDNPLAEDGIHGDTNFADMEYTRYDISDVQDVLDTIQSLEDASYNIDNLNTLTNCENTLIIFGYKVKTSYMLINVYYNQNPTQENLEEYLYTSEVFEEFVNEYYNYMGSIMESDFGTQLLEELERLSTSDDYYASTYLQLYNHYSSFLDDSSNMSDEAQEIMSQINTKTNEYYTLVQTDITDAEATFDGKTTTLGNLLAEYTTLYSSIISQYSDIDDVPSDTLETYFALEDTIDQTKAKYGVDNTTLGQLYLDIVKLNNQYAQTMGSENYVDLEYAYDSDEVEEISNYVKNTFTPTLLNYFDEYYSSSAYDIVKNVVVSVDDAEDFATDVIAQVGDDYLEVFNYLVSHDLLILDDDYVYSQGYTTALPEYSEAMIYLTYSSDSFYSWFINGVAHEFGHFVDWYTNVDGFASTSLATAENVSVSFSYLCLDNLDATLDENTSNALAVNGVLYNTYTYVNNTLSLNDFELYAFQNADTITVEDLESKYLELCKEYGLASDIEYELHCNKEYYWYTDNSQIYTQPFYMMDYAMAGITALNVLGEYVDDPESGLELFDLLYTNDDYYQSYYDMMESIGIDIYSDEYLENAYNAFNSYVSDKLSGLSDEDEETLLGDLDGNGTVDVMDLTNLKKYLLGIDVGDNVDISNADMNRDGKINLLDLLTLKKTLLNIA